MSLSILPPNCITIIASFLNYKDMAALAQVHRRCHAIMSQGEMPGTLEVLNERMEASGSTNYKEITVWMRAQTSLGNKLIIRPGIRFINFTDADIADDQLVQMIAGCPNLVSLNLTGCNRITKAGLKAIAVLYPHLFSYIFLPH